MIRSPIRATLQCGRGMCGTLTEGFFSRWTCQRVGCPSWGPWREASAEEPQGWEGWDSKGRWWGGRWEGRRPRGRPATSFGLSRLLVAKQLTWKGIELSHFIPASYLSQAETGLQMRGCACDAPIKKTQLCFTKFEGRGKESTSEYATFKHNIPNTVFNHAPVETAKKINPMQ